MIRVARWLFVCVVFATFAIANEPKRAVRDESTAIRIAVSAWQPVYGAVHIAGEKPYHATLHRGIWTVTGSLPQGMKCGVAVAKGSAEAGRITRISHGK